jgi:hypothetical protein
VSYPSAFPFDNPDPILPLAQFFNCPTSFPCAAGANPRNPNNPNLTILRDNKEIKVSLVLDKRPSE